MLTDIVLDTLYLYQTYLKFVFNLIKNTFNLEIHTLGKIMYRVVVMDVLRDSAKLSIKINTGNLLAFFIQSLRPDKILIYK